MPYADFSFYRDEYGGKSIPEADFLRISNKSSLIMGSYTGGPIENTDDRVKMACCAVSDLLYESSESSATGAEGAIQSETTGAWSVLYASGTTKSMDEKISDEISLYLSGLGLLSQAVPYQVGFDTKKGWRGANC